EAVEMVTRRDAFDLHPVTLRQFTAWLRDAGLEFAVVREQEQALTVGIEPPGRIDAGFAHVVLEGRPGLRTVRRLAELADHSVGLVQKNQGHRRSIIRPSRIRARSSLPRRNRINLSCTV